MGTRPTASGQLPESVERGEMVIDIRTEPDELGRGRFCACWRDPSSPAAGGSPGYVRGEVFYADLDQFTARNPGTRITIRSSTQGDQS
jgi:hypothetical protein